MKHARSGMALPAAIAGIAALAALAALANIGARVAIREAVALHNEAIVDAARHTLRARGALALARTARDSLIAAPRPLGGGDTMLVVQPLVWPWHRVSVTVSGVPAIAELARAPALRSWCAAIVTGGALVAAPGSVTLAAGSTCADAVIATTPDSVAAFDSVLIAGLALIAAPDTVRIISPPSPNSVVRAIHVIVVESGVAVTGVLVAPIVRIGASATARGLVVARDSVILAAGAAVTGDSAVAEVALRGNARLQLVGRRGLLLPP